MWNVAVWIEMWYKAFYTPDFEDLVQKKEYKHLIEILMLITC